MNSPFLQHNSAHTQTNKKAAFIKSVVGFSAITWIQAVVSFVCIPIMTRIIPIDEYGKINMFTLAVSLGTIFVRLSMEQGYIRFFYEREKERGKTGIVGLLSNCVSVNCIAFVVFMSILIPFAQRVSILLFDEKYPIAILTCLPLTVLATTFSTYQSSYFRMREDVKWYSICGAVAILTNKVSILGAAIVNPSMPNVALTMTVAIILGFFVIAAIKPASFSLRFNLVDTSSALPVIKYSLPWVPASLIAYLNTAVVSYILKENLSLGTLGIYASAISLANILAVVQAGFSVYWPAFMYKNYATEEAFIKKMHTWITMGMSIACLLVMALSSIIFLIVGESYRPGEPVFGLLVVGHAAIMIGETTCYGIYIAKKSYLQVVISAIALLTNASFAITMIPKYGILGAGMANAAGNIAYFALRTYFGQREYCSVEKFWRTLVSMLVLFAGGMACFLFAADFLKRTIVLLFLIIAEAITYRHEFTYLAHYLKAFITRLSKAT